MAYQSILSKKVKQNKSTNGYQSILSPQRKTGTIVNKTLPDFLGGGTYAMEVGNPNTMINAGHTTYGGVKTRAGYERADIFPVSLGGVNRDPNNITMEKNLPEFESGKNKQYRTATDKYLMEDILPKYKSGQMSLREAQIKATSYLRNEKEGLTDIINKSKNADERVKKLSDISDKFLGTTAKILSLPFKAVEGAEKLVGTISNPDLYLGKDSFKQAYNNAKTIGGIIKEGFMAGADVSNPKLKQSVAYQFASEFTGDLSDTIVDMVAIGVLGNMAVNKTKTIKITPDELSGKVKVDSNKAEIIKKVAEKVRNEPKEIIGEIKDKGLEIKIKKPASVPTQIGAKVFTGSEAKRPGVEVKIPGFDSNRVEPLSITKPTPSQKPQEARGEVLEPKVNKLSTGEDKLITEAKKYKTADEFVKAQPGKTLYRGGKYGNDIFATPRKELAKNYNGNSEKIHEFKINKNNVEFYTPSKHKEYIDDVLDNYSDFSELEGDMSLFDDIIYKKYKKLIESGKLNDSFDQYGIEPKIDNLFKFLENQIEDYSQFEFRQLSYRDMDGIQPLLEKAVKEKTGKTILARPYDIDGEGSWMKTMDDKQLLKEGDFEYIIGDTNKIKTSSQLKDIWNKAHKPKTIKTELPKTFTPKLAKSNKQKAIDMGMKESDFNNLPEVERINLEEQFNKASDYIKSNPKKTTLILRGEEPIPSDVNATQFLAAAEKYLRDNPNKDLAYDIANSELTRAASLAGQEVVSAKLREPDSYTSKIIELKKARKPKVDITKKKAKAKKSLKEEMKKNNLSKEDLSWDKFLEKIEC